MAYIPVRNTSKPLTSTNPCPHFLHTAQPCHHPSTLQFYPRFFQERRHHLNQHDNHPLCLHCEITANLLKELLSKHAHNCNIAKKCLCICLMPATSPEMSAQYFNRRCMYILQLEMGRFLNTYLIS